MLLWRYDARPIFRNFGSERIDCFVAAVALYLAGQALSAYRWQLLAALLKVPGRYREFVAYYFVGMFTNLFVPGLVGGDAAKSVYSAGGMAGPAKDGVGDAGAQWDCSACGWSRLLQ